MRGRHLLVSTAAVVLAVLHGCGTDSGSSPPPGGDAGADAAAFACDGVTPVLAIRAVRDGGSATCRTWLEQVRGRVVRDTVGSAVVWSRRTDEGYGVVFSAVHVLGLGWFGTSGHDVAEQMVPPETQGVGRLRVPPADGTLGLPELSPLYVLYNPEIPAAEYDDPAFPRLRPRHDVFMGIVDRHRVPIPDNHSAPFIPAREPGLVGLYDPSDATRTAPLGSEPAPGSTVLLVGYPQADDAFEWGAMAVGRVLDDDAARAAIASLAAAGDEEGTIPYDADAERILEGHALAGMSGGGAFDRDGKLAGILVRASDPTKGPMQYVRIVRLSYALARVHTAFARLAPSVQEAIGPFLDPAMREGPRSARAVGH